MADLATQNFSFPEFPGAAQHVNVKINPNNFAVVGADVSNFFVTGLVPFSNRLELTFNLPVTLSGPALLTSYWTVTGGTVAVTISSVAVTSASVVTVYISEPKGGESLTLSLPPSGIITPATPPLTGLYDGLFAIPFVAVAQSPIVLSAEVIDSTHVRVIFSESVLDAGALIAANYVITGGGGLAVFSVLKEMDRRYIITTAAQVAAQSYTVTVSNVRDLSQNPT